MSNGERRIVNVNPPAPIGCTSLSSRVICLWGLVSLWLRVYLKKQSQFIRAEYCVMRIAKGYSKKQSQFQADGSNAAWIPAFAGMTNMESLHGGRF